MHFAPDDIYLHIKGIKCSSFSYFFNSLLSLIKKHMIVESILLFFVTSMAKSLVAATPTTYYESVNELVIGNVNYTTIANAHIDLEFTHEYALLDGIDMVSFDKGPLITDIMTFHDYALEGSQWGDAAILELVIAYNAQPLDYLNNAEIQEYAAELTGYNATFLNILADSTSNPSIAEFFKKSASITEKTPGEKFLAKRENTKCSSSHSPTSSDCSRLSSLLYAYGDLNFGSTPRSYCGYGCCVSWSANATFSYSYAASELDFCVRACVNSNYSCEIFGDSVNGTLLDFCVSNRGTGCT